MLGSITTAIKSKDAAAAGLPTDASSVGLGQNGALYYQARRRNRCGIVGPSCATFDEGAHNMELHMELRAAVAALGSRKKVYL